MAASDTIGGTPRQRATDYLLRRHRFRMAEALPWLIAIAVFFIFPTRMTFGSQVLVMVMFALSLDLILGYAGIVTLQLLQDWSALLLDGSCCAIAALRC
jgi:hypothetical protein